MIRSAPKHLDCPECHRTCKADRPQTFCEDDRLLRLAPEERVVLFNTGSGLQYL